MVEVFLTQKIIKYFWKCKKDLR